MFIDTSAVIATLAREPDAADFLAENRASLATYFSRARAARSLDAFGVDAARRTWGRGGKAQLNFGDCLSYACAEVHKTSLLFKGDDFAATHARRA